MGKKWIWDMRKFALSHNQQNESFLTLTTTYNSFIINYFRTQVIISCNYKYNSMVINTTNAWKGRLWRVSDLRKLLYFLQFRILSLTPFAFIFNVLFCYIFPPKLFLLTFSLFICLSRCWSYDVIYSLSETGEGLLILISFLNFTQTDETMLISK